MDIRSDTFVDLACLYAKRILEDSGRRESAEKETPSLLSGGIWYAADYYKAIKRFRREDLLQNKADCGLFFHGNAPDEYLDHETDLREIAGKKPVSFRIKKGQLPSIALRKTEEGLSLLDCGTVCRFAVYKALCTLFGEEKFDRLFAFDSPFPFYLTNERAPPLSFLLIQKTVSGEADLRKGDICYFSNIKEYIFKHPLGESRGCQALCSEERPHLYLGLGMDPEGVDKEEAEFQLWDCYNRAPLDEGYLSPALWSKFYTSYLMRDEKKSRDLINVCRHKTLTLEEFKRLSPGVRELKIPTCGKLCLFILRPDLERIRALAENDVETAEKLLVKWSGEKRTLLS